MGTPRFTPEFKEEAVKQVTERGYTVSDVSAWLIARTCGLPQRSRTRRRATPKGDSRLHRKAPVIPS